MLGRRRRDLLVVALALSLLVPAVLYLTQLRPDETATVEQLVLPEQAAEARRSRKSFETHGDLLVVVLEDSRGVLSPARVAAFGDALEDVAGVAYVGSYLSRPRLGAQEPDFELRLSRGVAPHTGPPSLLDEFLRPNDGSAI